MDYKYEFTELAINDINYVLNYISYKLSNSKAATDLLIDIEKTIDKICLFPLSYPDCKYYYIKDESVRHVVIKNYVLFFKVIDSKVIILSFRYSKQNMVL